MSLSDEDKQWIAEQLRVQSGGFREDLGGYLESFGTRLLAAFHNESAEEPGTTES